MKTDSFVGIKKTFLFSFLFFVALSFSSPSFANASITYEAGNNLITVSGESTTRDLPWLYSQLNATYPGLQDQLLSYNGKIWYLKAVLSLNNSSMSIDGATVTELRMSNYYSGSLHEGDGLVGDFRISNTKITSWNPTLNRPADSYYLAEPQVGIKITGGYITDTVANNVYEVTITNPSQGSNNLTHINGKYGIIINSADHKTFYNIVNQDVVINGILCNNCTFVTLSKVTNIRGTAAGSNNGPGTNGGIIFSGGHDNMLQDVYANGYGWARQGVELNSCAYNITLKNITIVNSNHNGLDIHGARNVYVENMTIYGSISNNIIVTSSGCNLYDTYNVNFKNVRSYKAGVNPQISEGGDGFTAAPASMKVHDITLTDFYSEGYIKSIEASHVNPLKVFNFTTKNVDFGIASSYGTVPSAIIDSDISDHTTDGTSIFSVQSVAYPRIVNTKYSGTLLLNASGVIFYYYPDILVRDAGGNPLANAKITFTNEVDPLYPSINGNGDDKTVFYTDSNGHTFLPTQDRANSPAIAEKYLSYSQNDGYSLGTPTNLTWTMHVASPDNLSGAVVTGIAPSSSWYRTDPSVPANTITVQLSASTPPDNVAPATISNLSSSNPTENSITLNWSAPGDSGATGTAAEYDLRYSTVAITDANWSSATEVADVSLPGAAGSAETFTVTGLNQDTTYYFAIKTVDKAYNWSGLSNISSAVTTPHPEPSGLIGKWSFDEGSGTAVADSSGNNDTGTVSGATWVEGAVGGALSFNGTDARVDIPNSSTINIGDVADSYSVSFWINTSDTGQSGYILTKGSYQTTGKYSFRANMCGTGYVCFRLSDVDGNCINIQTTTSVADGAWHQIVLVRDMTAGKDYIYADGLLNEQASDPILSSMKNSSGIKIGANDDNTNFYHGLFDDLRIYNSALTGSEISSGYHAIRDAFPVTPPPAFTPTVSASVPAGQGVVIANILDSHGSAVAGANYTFTPSVGSSVTGTTDSNGQISQTLVSGVWGLQVVPPSGLTYAANISLPTVNVPDADTINLGNIYFTFTVPSGADSDLIPIATPPAGCSQQGIPIITRAYYEDEAKGNFLFQGKSADIVIITDSSDNVVTADYSILEGHAIGTGIVIALPLGKGMFLAHHTLVNIAPGGGMPIITATRSSSSTGYCLPAGPVNLDLRSFFTGSETTDLSQVTDFRAVSDLTFHQTNVVKVAFANPVNMLDPTVQKFLNNLASKVVGATGSLNFDAQAVLELKNAGAVITFYNISMTDPKILVDGADDTGGVTSDIVYDTNAHTFTFSASHFTTFSLVEEGIATSYTLNAPNPANGLVGAASGNFTITPNGLYTGTITITPSGGGLTTSITKEPRQNNFSE